MKSLEALLSIIILLIGLYMTVSFWGGELTPPVLSGIAFIAIAVRQLLK